MNGFSDWADSAGILDAWPQCCTVVFFATEASSGRVAGVLETGVLLILAIKNSDRAIESGFNDLSLMIAT